ncbi:unnamed protein product [Musa acuminata subsp. malaccensis]|uniref:(wild Malaysian banana) hypothetical protein n=1 Tax=Musa acuminata subsp. malaccensis TaxID=214687 RepID=A0A804J5V4_MUSAM|nr:unnamed protein product [Musa acuminata subsp. malaccensis]
MKIILYELSNDSDITSGVFDFARRHHVGIFVLGDSGIVANITLCHPSVHGFTSISMSGHFDILSISSTFFLEPPSSSGCIIRLPPLIIALVRPDGQIIGGKVAGPMMVVGPVTFVVAIFSKPELHRLPVAEKDEAVAMEEDVKPGLELFLDQLLQPVVGMKAQQPYCLPLPDAHCW